MTINGFILQAGEYHRPVRFPGQTITGFPGATRNHPVFYPAPSTGNNHHKITTNRPMKPLNFIAIDFETANAKRSSICEVGICVVRNGEISETRSWLVQPEDNFYHYRNIQIHGIRPEDTENAPDFKQVWEEIERTYLDEFDTLVAHNAPFDRSCLQQAAELHRLLLPDLKWDCTLKHARRLYAFGSYTLDYLCDCLDIPCGTHHRAGDDAEMCARLYLKEKSL